MAVLKLNQRGAIVIMTVFFVIILIAFAALALDLGRLYVLRTDMQNAADAAALAGAVELDGKPDARNRAVRAATNLLSHKGQFSTSPELLKQLASYWNSDPAADPATNPFVFYSWIGAEPDAASWDCNKSTESWEDGVAGSKCITTDDADARYIRVKLDPELTTAEKKDSGIDFYFLPVLSLITGSPITEGFTKVMAIAGNTDSSICNLPPLMICEPEGGFDAHLSRGQQVILKTQGAGATWLPGDFAFLEPVQCLEGEADCTSISQLNKALAAQLAEERQLGCTPPVVSPLPGDRQATAYAVNTRMGLYGSYGGVTYSSDTFPSSTDIVDYPRDQNFEDINGNIDPNGRFGTGDWDPTTYFASHHNGMAPPFSTISRFQTYYWELNGTPSDWNEIYHNEWENNEVASLSDVAQFPNYDPADDPTSPPPDPAYAQCAQAPVGAAWDHPNNRDCLNLTGDPSKQPSETPPGTGVDWAKPSRRVWFVAALNCADYEDDINNRKPFTVTFGPDGNGEFVKFFLTEHVKKGPPTEIVAEYLGPASGEEEDHILIHNIVQLYE